MRIKINDLPKVVEETKEPKKSAIDIVVGLTSYSPTQSMMDIIHHEALRAQIEYNQLRKFVSDLVAAIWDTDISDETYTVLKDYEDKLKEITKE